MTVDYRSRERTITLPVDGILPNVEELPVPEQTELLSTVSGLWHLLNLSAGVGFRPAQGQALPTEAAIRQAWRRWILGHHVFISQFSLIAESFDQAAIAYCAGDIAVCSEWLERAVQLRRGQSALFLYSVDFEPCGQIYCGLIRSMMPPGFTGYEILERQNAYQPALVRLHLAIPDGSELWNHWNEADRCYLRRHVECMKRAVPSDPGAEPGSLPKSLRELAIASGQVQKIDAARFQAYDQWFRINRDAGMSRLSFAFEVSDLIERIIANIMTGHRLDQEALADLVSSLRTMTLAISRWAGPIEAISPFFHPSLVCE